MKRLLLILTISLFAFSACSSDDNDNTTNIPETQEVSIDASSYTNWNYYSLKDNKLVGTGTEADNSTWAARSDWDIAVMRYSIKTNSGESTSINSQGGVYTTDSSISFESLTSIPSDAKFVTDVAVTSYGMSGETTVVKSNATVIVFKTEEDGSMVMPPIYLQAPTYIFRSADAQNYYKVLFTQYKNDDSVTGHVKFKFSQIQ